MSPSAKTGSQPGRKVAGQGLLLFAGFGAAQALSLIRNGVLGHALSPTDFGIAAIITLMLQLTETLSDLGSDRLIIQAPDGDARAFVASAHAVLLMRGILIAAVFYLCAPLVTAAFAIPQALTALQITALAPLIKGFMHLDMRVAQRQLNNRPQLLIELVPQVIALALVFPVLARVPDFSAVAWLAVAQAIASVIASHVLATRRYGVGITRDLLNRHIAFGWPVLLSALPLVAVYQGERLMIGQTLGVEALAAFSVAFSVTMVPGLIAAKVGHALLLPLFSDALRQGADASTIFARKFVQATEATILLAAMYVVAFVVAGDRVIPLVFGSHYHGLGVLAGVLASMWALRMIQAVPGMALMAHGETKPFVAAGIIRAHALPAAFIAAHAGYGLITMAALGLAFECLSLVYVSFRMNAFAPDLARAVMLRALMLLPVATLGSVISTYATTSWTTTVAQLVVAVMASAAMLLLAMPGLRRDLVQLLPTLKPSGAWL